jgi:hypothetical protein
VQGTTLTGFVGGQDVLHATNGEVARGKVNAGATADNGNPADVTFDGFRVFAPPQQNNPNPNPTKKHTSPSSSPSWDSTPSEPPPTTWQPTPTS